MSKIKENNSSCISIPWGAWFGDKVLNLGFPRSWNISVNCIADAKEIDDEKIRMRIQQPVGTNALKQIAVGKQKVAIAVEDITRPSELHMVLKFILQELYSAGVNQDQIYFVLCNGAHAPMHKEDLEKKLGVSVAEKYRAINHSPYENLSDTGIVIGKTPVLINRNFLEADLRIGIGTIMPHNFAGFSAGAKLVLPGLADIATLERTHKYVMMGFRGGVNDVENNRFRSEIEGVVKKIGLDLFVGVVLNSNRKIAGVFAGDIIVAHRAGVKFAREIYSTTFEPSADVVILNAYPKDSELLQADTALTPLKTAADDLVQEKGVMIITSRCSKGLGYHSLLGPGMRLSRKPNKISILKGRDLILFSQKVNQAEFLSLYWQGYCLAADWDSITNSLKQRFARHCRVSVFPTAPLQLLQ